MSWLNIKSSEKISFTDWSRAILNSIDQPFLALDRKLKIVAVNPAMEVAFFRWTGIHLYVGQNYLEVLPEETIAERMKIYRRAFSGERISIEQEYNLGNEIRTYIVTYDPLILNSQIVGIIGNAKDITHQKIEERRIRETTQKFENAFNHTMIGMAITSMDGCLVQANPALCKMLGYTQEEFSRLKFQDLTHPDDLPRNMQMLNKLLSGDLKCMEIEKRYRRKDGEYIETQLSCSIVRDEKGEPLLYVAAIHDITPRLESMRATEKAKENLRRQTEELARSNAELERFAYVASHDLQEPLRMIVSYLQFLDLEYHGHLSSQADEYLHFAVDGAKRMSILIRDLLTYSRVGRAELKLQEVRLNEVIDIVLQNLDSLIRDSSAKIECEKLPALVCDRYQMLRVFQNLIENSLKYRSSRPLEVKISAVERSNELEISVSDNGIGFDQANAEKIFNVFQRLHDREKYPGSGIGLSIVQTIVHRHGGSVRATSVPDSGTTITITFPKSSLNAQDTEGRS